MIRGDWLIKHILHQIGTNQFREGYRPSPLRSETIQKQLGIRIKYNELVTKQTEVVRLGEPFYEIWMTFTKRIYMLAIRI